MENSSQPSALQQKLNQHDLGYRPGAWENFEQMFNAAPLPAPKKSFWNYKKWLGIGSAAVLLISGVVFFKGKGHDAAQSLPTPAVMSAPTETQNIVPTEKNVAEKNPSTSAVKTQKIPIPMQTASPSSSATTKGDASLSQHEDSRLPVEGELKVRPLQPFQRASRSGSDDSGVLPNQSRKQDTKKEHDHIVKKNIDLQNEKIPDAHELENHVKN
jgi:hypothetical protein